MSVFTKAKLRFQLGAILQWPAQCHGSRPDPAQAGSHAYLRYPKPGSLGDSRAVSISANNNRRKYDEHLERLLESLTCLEKFHTEPGLDFMFSFLDSLANVERSDSGFCGRMDALATDSAGKNPSSTLGPGP